MDGKIFVRKEDNPKVIMIKNFEELENLQNRKVNCIMNVLNNQKCNIQYKKSQSIPETNYIRINENIIQKENHSNFNYNKINLTTIKNEEHLNINMNSPTKNNAEMKKSNTLKIIQLNIRSMRKHFNELIIKINELEPDKIAPCETFLSESELNLYKIPNYELYMLRAM